MNNRTKIILSILMVLSALLSIYTEENYKYFIPIVIVTLGIILTIVLTIWKIIETVNEKKYGKDEKIKTDRFFISENNFKYYLEYLTNGIEKSIDIEEFKSNYTLEVNEKTTTKELIENINTLLEKEKYNSSINLDDIYKYDYDCIKKRRSGGYSTLTHDINVIANILNNFNIDMIIIYENRKENKINFALISFENIEKIL